MLALKSSIADRTQRLSNTPDTSAKRITNSEKKLRMMLGWINAMSTHEFHLTQLVSPRFISNPGLFVCFLRVILRPSCRQLTLNFSYLSVRSSRPANDIYSLLPYCRDKCQAHGQKWLMPLSETNIEGTGNLSEKPAAKKRRASGTLKTMDGGVLSLFALLIKLDHMPGVYHPFITPINGHFILISPHSLTQPTTLHNIVISILHPSITHHLSF